MNKIEFDRGARHATRVLFQRLDINTREVPSYKNQYAVTEDWFGHLIARHTDPFTNNGEPVEQCNCELERDWDDGTYDVAGCKDWRNDAFRRAWHCEWFGITLEELARREQAEQEMAQVNDAAARRREIEYHKAMLEELLRDKGVQIQLPQF
jgi:hypothetical protein